MDDAMKQKYIVVSMLMIQYLHIDPLTALGDIQNDFDQFSYWYQINEATITTNKAQANTFGSLAYCTT